MKAFIFATLVLVCAPALRAGAAPPSPRCQDLEAAIHQAGGATSLNELVAVVRDASASCSTSPAVAGALTGWLREDHPLYAGRRPTETSQFRGFLLASLGSFPPNDDLYGYVRAELSFGGHSFPIATAAIAARRFPERAAELVPLLEPFLGSSFADERVDTTTPDLNYPILHPTKARYEIIKTLAAFGAPAYRSVRLLEEIAACDRCGLYGNDPDLARQAAGAAEAIRQATPVCCRHEATESPVHKSLQILDRSDRKPLPLGRLRLLDQEGRPLRFADLTGKPFVLTFFYSQCTNAMKCASSVHRLGELESVCAREGLGRKVGLYAMTYDPRFDSPSIMKKYGMLYGVDFDGPVRFLKTADDSGAALHDQLGLRVNYGAGTVNQHGIQLFVFDKKGRLAATSENDRWTVGEVKDYLVRLTGEIK
ncbi:MAG TPA: SCO family protein [Thermoanaerobaculia bacterium]|jgi:cytochrome oxidase Cu insertion factor (SCO1/SenC/PrrC family)|nr:SCO family protein [Thermoanaerobaculia bacterium]